MSKLAGTYNRLQNEQSPYLRQHAENPVNWYPWGEEAFTVAKAEDKPIFLSIGYSTCHWCHVMERESFEDEEVASLMNEVFVSVKVDREERPDLDGIYMEVCQAMTGSGGWPLTVILTPEQQPFYAGTYFPKNSSFGRVGMLELIRKIQELWKKHRDELVTIAEKNTAGLRAGEPRSDQEDLDITLLEQGFGQLAEAYDAEHGGFGFAPKFPTPHNLNFLLRYWKRSGAQRALEMVERTLNAMRDGGIYDQIGYGFHRYSTDERWLVPHFEKMLYDQALLILAYLESYQVTGNNSYRQTAEEVFTYLTTVLRDPSGGFYSAEDADSEGVEGKFYLWTSQEVAALLNPEETALFTAYFGLTADGNFRSPEHEAGANILYRSADLTIVAQQLGLDLEQARELLTSARTKLYTNREQRVHPFKDDKILTDWNGLVLAALAKGGRVLQAPRWVQAATAVADFLLTVMRRPDGGLWHRYRHGEAGITAFLDDYAFLIWGLLELYETTFTTEYLAAALELASYLRRHFFDQEQGGYFQTSSAGEQVLARRKELYDGAIPSGNSSMVLNLLRLARITGDPALQQEAERTSAAFADRIRRSPVNYTQLLSALDFAFGPTREIVVAGRRGDDLTERMLGKVAASFNPRQIALFRPVDVKNPEITRLAPFTKELTAIEGQATAYVCQNYQCNLPTTDWDRFRQLLEGSAPD